jgi:hypothetical protein
MTLVSVVFVALFGGVGHSQQGNEYFAVTSGMRTVYDVKALSIVGVLEGNMIVREDGTQEIGNHTYHKIVTTTSGLFEKEDPKISYIRLGADGIYSRRSMDPSLPEAMDLPLPPEIGKKWTYTNEEGNQVAMEIAGVLDFDTVANTFERCLKIISKESVDQKEQVAIAYIAPRVGLARMATTLEGVSFEMTIRDE